MRLVEALQTPEVSDLLGGMIDGMVVDVVAARLGQTAAEVVESTISDVVREVVGA